MKKIFSFFAALAMTSLVVNAQTEIVFAGSGTGSDSSTKYTTESTDMFTEATKANVASISAVDNVYAARTTEDGVNCGVKFGASSKAGSITLVLANPTEVEKIVISAAKYGDSEGGDGFTANGTTCTLSAGNKVFEDKEITPAGVVSEITIAQVKADKGRFYLNKITIYPKSGSVTPVDPVVVIDGPVVATVEKKAENLSTGLAAAATRGGFVVDGDKVLVTSAADGKLYQFSAADLSALGQITDSIQGGSYYMDMDDAGNYVFFEWTVGSTSRDGAYIYNKTAKAITHVDLPIGARADQPSCAGNLVSGKGAILISGNGLEYVNRYNFVDGVLTTTDSIATPGFSGGGINTISAIDVDHFFVQLRSSGHIYVDATDVANPVVKKIAVKNLSGNFWSAHGSEVFQLAGHTFLAVGNYTVGAYLGAFNIIDVTDPENAYSVFAEPTNAGTGAMGASAVEFRVVVVGDKAEVYEFAGFQLRKYEMTVRAAQAGTITIEKKNVVDLVRLEETEVNGTLRFNVTGNDAMGEIAVTVKVDTTELAATDFTFEDGELAIPYKYDAVGVHKYVITAQGLDEGGIAREATLEHTLTIAEPLVEMTIAEAIEAGEKAEVMLGEVYISFNPFDKQNLYVADATGALLVYYKNVAADFDVNDKDLYSAGASYTGLQGTMTLYNGIWEIVPTVKSSDLKFAADVTVEAKPYTTLSADLTNEYVALDTVAVVAKTEGTYTNYYAQFEDGTEVQVYNKWKIAGCDVEDGKTYNLKGVMTLFKNVPELYTTEAEEVEIVEDGVENLKAGEKPVKFVKDGQLYILKNGVTYTVLGAQAE